MDALIPSHWHTDVRGSNLTSIKIGGPLQYVSRPKTAKELAEDIQVARNLALPYRVIGGGSNILFADAGLQGLVVQPSFKGMEIVTDNSHMIKYEKIILSDVQSRYKQDSNTSHLKLAGAVETAGSPIFVEVEAGVPWGQLVLWSLGKNLLGLHWFARIPCTMGGAVFNNIHGASHFLSEFLVGVYTFNPEKNEEGFIAAPDLNLNYDYSCFHETNEIITKAVLRLYQSDEETSERAKHQYLAWTREKNERQPIPPNCGSVFKNLTSSQVPVGEQAVAAGYYVEHAGCLGLKEGGMQVYETHGNFIINTGAGTQEEFIRLVTKVQTQVQQKYEVLLQPEVECITRMGEKYIW